MSTPKSGIAVPLYSFGFVERARRAVMDFGFGAFLEKFEAYFGKPATRLLLFIIGLTVFVACANTVLTLGAQPIYQYFPILRIISWGYGTMYIRSFVCWC